MSPSGPPPYMVVGHLNKAHGTKGELFIWPLTDYPGSHFAPGVVLFLTPDQEATAPSESLAPLTIETVRPFRKGFLVRFLGIGSRSQAEHVKDLYCLRPFDTMDELAEGEVFYHELLGTEVVDTKDVVIGKVREVYSIRPNDLLEVEGPNGTHMIPFIPEIVVSVDREKRRIVVDPPQGLFDQ